MPLHWLRFLISSKGSFMWHQACGKRPLKIARQEIQSRHYVGYSFQLAARDLLYASSYREDSTNHILWYTSCGILGGMRNG